MKDSGLDDSREDNELQGNINWELSEDEAINISFKRLWRPPVKRRDYSSWIATKKNNYGRHKRT
jgi:hypothetical protein